MLLRCNVSSMVVSRPASGSEMRFSSSLRVTLTSELKPGSSAGTTVAVSADSRSLACRASSRSRASDPSPSVPVGSASLASAIPATTWLSSAWSIWSPEKSGYRTVSPIWSKFEPASASVMLVPLPPRSTKRDDAARRQPRCRLQRRERRDRIRDERRGHTVRRKARLGAQRTPQRTNGSGAPVCGHGDRDGGAAAYGVRHRVEGFHKHALAAVRGAVGGDQRNRVADPLDETAQHQAGLVQVRVLARHADFGGAIVEQRENGTAHDRGTADSGRHQVGHPNGQPE